MKRYKLIKTYPGSPELGIVVEQNRGKTHYVNNDDITYYYHNSNIESHPEFWKEVIEKDYEIITFGFEEGVDRTLDKYGKYSLVTGGEIEGKDGNSLIDLTGKSPYYIKSVRRLNDGVTFSIGDMCNPVATDYKYNKKPITKIWFTEHGSLRISSENYTLPINGIEHSEIPIFTSEDGVDIYEGDKYYYVSESGKGVYTLITKNEKPLSGNGKRFSTKKAAENYIFNSVKRFSINDVIEAIPSDNDNLKATLSKMLDNLKDLAKQQPNK